MDKLYKKVKDGIDNQPFARLLGLELKEAVEGEVTISCARREELLQQTGILHGGVIAAVCEAAGGYAALTVLPERSSALAVEYKVNFMRPAAGSGIRARSRLIKSGRKIMIADVEAYDLDTNKMIAKMIITMMPA